MTRDTQKILWAVGLTAVAGAVIGGVIYASSKSEKKTVEGEKQPEGSAPSVGGGSYAVAPAARFAESAAATGARPGLIA